MLSSRHIVKVPGKLMIAGEYAVLEPKQKSVVAAVNRYVTAYIDPSNENKLSLPDMGLIDIAWEIANGDVKFDSSDTRLDFIRNSIAVVSEFLKEKSGPLSSFKMDMKSQLDDTLSGKKYGLGSSAAVTAAVVSAILYFHNYKQKPSSLEDIFKLSVLAHFKTQGSGSGADIAASIYGGWLEYSAFDSKWLLNKLKNGISIDELVEKPWPNLYIKAIEPPDCLRLAVGWTEEAAKTAPMIKKVQGFKDSNLEAYNEFLLESSLSVSRLIKGFEDNNCAEAIKALEQNREALKKLGEIAGVSIETEKIKTLCSIAERFGGAKSSGAGGGDCGIAFLDSESKRQELHRAWEAADIKPLDLSVSEIGVNIVE
jgi:phosphomevalonate kinase